MISLGYVQRLARYNRWQNGQLYAAAGGVSDEERTRQRGAFFGSIQATLNHLLWADRMWMSRFAGTPRPEGGIADSVSLCRDWQDLRRARVELDETIVEWAEHLEPAWLAGDLTWHSGVAKREITGAKWILVSHFFNHQTHHRGQVHCLLTQAGQPGYVTDLGFMPG